MQMNPYQLEVAAPAAARLLKVLANEHRLLLLCKLTEVGRARAGDLGEAVGLSQSAASQHLAKMRDEGVIDFEREAQTLWYKIIDPNVEAVLATLYGIFCAPHLQKSAEYAPASGAGDTIQP